jgi:diguanylate cyclase (GGDEF)-like protein
VDNDDFKALNDRHGRGGRRRPRGLAALLVGETRDQDLVARYGGEEFAILAPGTDRAGALALAEKLRVAASESFFDVAGQRIAITVSVGIAVYHGDREAFFHEADRALYAAKGAGKDCVVAADVIGLTAAQQAGGPSRPCPTRCAPIHRRRRLQRPGARRPALPPRARCSARRLTERPSLAVASSPPASASPRRRRDPRSTEEDADRCGPGQLAIGSQSFARAWPRLERQERSFARSTSMRLPPDQTTGARLAAMPDSTATSACSAARRSAWRRSISSSRSFMRSASARR